MIKHDLTEFKIWEINEGNHYCNNFFRFRPYSFKARVSYNVIFAPSCEYYLPSPDNLDLNKLFGMSFGLHHIDSARYGWRYNGKTKEIDIHSYCYIKGKLTYSFICSLKFNTQYRLTIVKLEGKYSFIATLENDIIKQVNIPRSFSPDYGYELFPYFGGNNVAPHDIKILMYKNE